MRARLIEHDSGEGPSPLIEPSIECARDPLAQPVNPGSPGPATPIELERLGAVVFENCGGHGREIRILHLLVGLEVPLEAPAIEVARADRYPIVTYGHLAVQDARLKLKNADRAAQQLTIEAACRLAHPGMIRQGAGYQQPHIHAAPRSPAQRLAEAPRGHEVGAHDPNTPVRG